MIRHVWSVLCEQSILDRDSNLMSLVNILEEVTIQGEPDPKKKIPIPLLLTTLWVRVDRDLPVKVNSRYCLKSPSGETIQTIERQIDLTEYRRLRFRAQFFNIVLPESGTYEFISAVQTESGEWEDVDSIPLEVNFVQPNQVEKTE